MKCNRNGNTLTFTFDGATSVSFDADRCTALTNDAAMHGFEQKIRDNAALSRNIKINGVETVRTITEAMRRDAVLEMVTHLEKNETWNMKATARQAPQNQVIIDLANAHGITYAQAEAMIANMAIEKMMKGE